MIRTLPAVCAAAALLASASQVAAKNLQEARLEDLQAIRAGYVQKSQAFSPHGRIRAHQLIDRLETRAGSLTEAQLMIGLMQVAALARNGQDSFDFGDGSWVPPRRAKVRLLWFPDGVVVARAAPEYRDLLSAKVTRIDGLTPYELMRRLRSVGGGTDAYRGWDLMWLIETGAGLQAMGVAAAPDRLNLELTLPGGRKVARRIEFGPRADIPRGVASARILSAEPYGIEAAHGWRTATDPKADPLYLQDGDRLFRMIALPEIDGVYVQFRSNFDQDSQEIAPFVRAVEARLGATHPRNLVLDERFNTGGDIGQTRDLMRAIPKLVGGRIYVLTGSRTFSAGIVSAAALKHDGGDRVKVVGAPVGDRLRFWSEGEQVCTPNAHFCLHETTGLWDLADGCKDEPACYGDQFDANVGDLRPDIRAPLTAKAWLAGRDPALEAVKADLARR